MSYHFYRLSKSSDLKRGSALLLLLMVVYSALFLISIAIVAFDSRQITNEAGEAISMFVQYDHPLFFWVGTYRTPSLQGIPFFLFYSYAMILPIFLLPLCVSMMVSQEYLVDKQQKIIGLVMSRLGNAQYFFSRLLATFIYVFAIFFLLFLVQALVYPLTRLFPIAFQVPPISALDLLQIPLFSVVQATYYGLLGTLSISISYLFDKSRVLVFLIPILVTLSLVLVPTATILTNPIDLLYIDSGLVRNDRIVVWITFAGMFLLSLLFTAIKVRLSRNTYQ